MRPYKMDVLSAGVITALYFFHMNIAAPPGSTAF